MDIIKYLAHIEPVDYREQTIIEHVLNTAQKARAFANVFNAGDEAYRCGILHDIGKYSMAFQRRIRGNAERTDHSTAGALEAAALGDVPAAFCIAGHHGGLPDLGNRKADSLSLQRLRLAQRKNRQRTPARQDSSRRRHRLRPASVLCSPV